LKPPPAYEYRSQIVYLLEASMFFKRTFLFALLAASGFLATAEEPVDLDMINRIREEGLHNSQVMATLAYLTDVIGPRLTGSPQMLEANEWTRQTMKDWGLKNTAVEPWGEFGRGWSYSRASVHMLEPHATNLFAIPQAWTPGTDGPVSGPVMKASINSEEDFEDYRGKLSGKILLLSDERDPRVADAPLFRRHSDEDLKKIADFPIPNPSSGHRNGGVSAAAITRWELFQKMRDFYVEEGVLALLRISRYDAGIIHVNGNRARKVGQNPGPPVLFVASNQYNHMLRLLDRDIPVRLEVDVEAQFHEDDVISYNTVAEIPGSGSKRKELVLLGGHLDSWHASTGATDNAAGCAVAMEAVRILKALNVEPRRTIRVVLWSGEEQGLNGSREYVKKHFASRPPSDDPEEAKRPRHLREVRWPLKTTKAHHKFSVYFNLDNGGGKIRGIYLQENAAAKPIFEAWFKPFEDLGAHTVTLRNTRGTDHLSFDAVGLPGFQFIQDPLEYTSQTHHTNLDGYERIQRNDLTQASVLLAAFVYHAAMRGERFPRKPFPQEPEED
jgi:hypothetical protein